MTASFQAALFLLPPAVLKKNGAAILLAAAFLAFGPSAGAQENAPDTLLPEFRGQALVLDIVARLSGEGQETAQAGTNAAEVQGGAWDSSSSRVTIPGRPVGIKLVGSNIVVAVQFTPFRRGEQNFLVAIGQVWLNIPGKGISYHTTLESVPLAFGEPVYFFPLGRGDDQSILEIQVAMRPWTPPEAPVQDQ
jgi:hypothetical protein